MSDITKHSAPESFLLPPIWDDDDAMYSLMQPIKRPKHVDPEAYNRKVKFWTDLVFDYAKHQRVSVISIRCLQTVFSRYFIDEGIHLTPQCLPEVFDSLLQLGVLEAHQDRSSVLRTVLWTGFDYLVKAPLSWTLRFAFGDTDATESQSRSTTCGDFDPDQLYVLRELSENLASQFLSYFNANYHTHRLTLRLPVYELDEFESALAQFFPHDATRNYIRRLCVDVFRCVRFESVSDPDGTWKSQVVRVSSGIDTQLPSPTRSPDTQTEMSVLGGLAHLRTVIKHQEAEEQKLATEIDERRNRIKVLMKNNRIREAKNLLQRTKVLEKSLSQRQTHLHNLEAMQIQIDSASDNQAVLRALAGSGRALQQTTGGAEGLAKIEDTMHDIADTLQDSNEVSDLLSNFGQTTLGSDVDDLETELNDLLKPEPETPERRAVPPVPAQADSSSSLEAELNALNLTDLSLLPDVPDSPSREQLPKSKRSGLLG